MGVRRLPKKPGRPPNDLDVAILKMRELLESGQLKSERRAAKAAEASLGLPRGTWESLRKSYAARRNAGTLPAIESRTDVTKRMIREGIVARERWKEGLRAQLATKEEEAAALGLNITGIKDWSVLLRSMRHERDQYVMQVHSPDVALNTALEKGLTADEADAWFSDLTVRYEKIKKVLEILEAIEKLQMALKPIRTVSTQNGQEDG